ncbi:demethoxyubiquinone hydroxylase family protein [Aspergillus candidus]|uniref:5-demethoxyubiquinone hydroxylase, mitochondrial n=1 Tax=Aspergillus candidus TaxID=41067 RepID=A0A2I2FLY1_ASPCN|nr:COQ7-domain-containing protein [Aspergillus candidus]PLB41632.1 COQ7-domain-containing protein [Aspergillus candidus]
MKPLQPTSTILSAARTSITPRVTQPRPSRLFWSSTNNASDTSSNTSGNTTNTDKKIYRLNPQQKNFLDRALRVNQAGELAATLIYASQSPLITRSQPHLRPLMKHMYDQEAAHLSTFNNLIATHRVRPTAMTPVWRAAASFLGWSTACLGREAAMACTEAVETEIGTHYNDQVREILSWEKDAAAKGEVLDEEVASLVTSLRRIRDEELEHLDHAVEHDAKMATPYDPLVGVIRAGCRGAIEISERV